MLHNILFLLLNLWAKGRRSTPQDPANAMWRFLPQSRTTRRPFHPSRGFIEAALTIFCPPPILYYVLYYTLFYTIFRSPLSSVFWFYDHPPLCLNPFQACSSRRRRRANWRTFHWIIFLYNHHALDPVNGEGIGVWMMKIFIIFTWNVSQVSIKWRRWKPKLDMFLRNRAAEFVGLSPILRWPRTFSPNAYVKIFAKKMPYFNVSRQNFIF